MSTKPPDDEQKQIQALVGEFTKRTEAILAALAMGASFEEIEDYLDYLDATERADNVQGFD